MSAVREEIFLGLAAVSGRQLNPRPDGALDLPPPDGGGGSPNPLSISTPRAPREKERMSERP